MVPRGGHQHTDLHRLARRVRRAHRGGTVPARIEGPSRPDQAVAGWNSTCRGLHCGGGSRPDNDCIVRAAATLPGGRRPTNRRSGAVMAGVCAQYPERAALGRARIRAVSPAPQRPATPIWSLAPARPAPCRSTSTTAMPSANWPRWTPAKADGDKHSSIDSRAEALWFMVDPRRRINDHAPVVARCTAEDLFAFRNTPNRWPGVVAGRPHTSFTGGSSIECPYVMPERFTFNAGGIVRHWRRMSSLNARRC